MISVRNSQRKIFVDVKKLVQDAHTILSTLKYKEFDLGIWLTTNKTIQRYNKRYRGNNKATDILSFSYHPNLRAGERITPKTDDDKNLGDLIIAPEYVLQDSKKLGASLDRRMQVLLVHGICHLLGYDHVKDEDYKIMHRKELSLLKKLR